MKILVEPDLRCPQCGGWVSSTRVPGTPYRCPRCLVELMRSPRADRVGDAIMLTLAVAATYLLGFRGWALLGGSAIAFVVILFAEAQLSLRFYPPKLVPYDGRKIWL